MNCRHCGCVLGLAMADLGQAPPSNSYLEGSELGSPQKFYPLRVLVCTGCWLAQTEDFVDREECFSSSYAYFSSCSESWVRHAGAYAAEMIDRWNLGSSSLVVEVAANDGYLLRHFAAAGIPCYGVEPTDSTARAARSLGLEIVSEFFGEGLASRLKDLRGPVDLLAANNVLAHVPAINDFARGVGILLKPGGVATFEFPHLLALLQNNYFDTIYHEHFSYLSLHAASAVLARAGLAVFDVEELPTHGGSLRVFAAHKESAPAASDRVADFLRHEREGGLLGAGVYLQFQKRIAKVREDFLAFLRDALARGLRVAAYGAAAKGNTLLNYCGVGAATVSFVVDRSPGKVGKYLPGSLIPVVPEDRLRSEKPDIIVILPWNLRGEIAAQLSYARGWGAQFAVALPKLETF